MKHCWFVAMIMMGCGHKDVAALPSADAANALVNHAKNPNLVFESRPLTVTELGRSKTFQAVVPAGWFEDKDKQRLVLQRPDGSVSSIAFDFSCYREPCELPDDFKKKFEANLQGRVATVAAKVLRDESNAQSRLFSTKDEGELVAIDRYWWGPGKPSEYYVCNVVLTPDLEPSRAAFEQACETATAK